MGRPKVTKAAPGLESISKWKETLAVKYVRAQEFILRLLECFCLRFLLLRYILFSLRHLLKHLEVIVLFGDVLRVV